MELKVTHGLTKTKVGAYRVDVEITDLRKKDRAVCLYYLLPVQAAGWRWWDYFDDLGGAEIDLALSGPSVGLHAGF